MRDGWHSDEYLTLFSDTEKPQLSERYDFNVMLPGYQLLGLRGWHEFIVRDSGGDSYTLPIVPCDKRGLKPYDIAEDNVELVIDIRFRGKIKWYVQPLVFGGDPDREDNVTWVTLQQHVDLVRWWNAKYRDLTAHSRQ